MIASTPVFRNKGPLVPGADDRIWLYVMKPPFGPGRNALARLREMALSTAPSEQVDAELFRTLDPAGSDSFLKVSRSTIYRVEGKEDYGEDDEVLLCSHDDSIDYINYDRETVYWGGKPPGFWDEWLALPKYTTNYDAAVGLKSHVLGFGRTVVLEEFESMVSEDEDMMRIVRTFRAEIRDTDGTIVRGPTVGTPAVAVLVAMLDYLLALPIKAAPAYSVPPE